MKYWGCEFHFGSDSGVTHKEIQNSIFHGSMIGVCVARLSVKSFHHDIFLGINTVLTMLCIAG